MQDQTEVISETQLKTRPPSPQRELLESLDSIHVLAGLFCTVETVEVAANCLTESDGPVMGDGAKVQVLDCRKGVDQE